MLFIVGIAYARTKRHLTTFKSTREAQDRATFAEIARQLDCYTQPIRTA